MVRKYIRFNYFSVNLVPDGLPEGMENRHIGNIWDMSGLLDYLSVRRQPINSVVNVGEYLAEFERDTLIYDPQNNLSRVLIIHLIGLLITWISSLGDNLYLCYPPFCSWLECRRRLLRDKHAS